MSSFDVGTAFVRVVPDTRGFQALLTAQVNAAVRAVSAAVPVSAAASTATSAAAAANTAVAASATSAAAATGTMAAASGIATTENVKEASSALAVARALEAERLAQERLTAAIGRGASASRIATLQNQATLATEGVRVAQLRAEAATRNLTGANNLLQGSILGLSRITPLAVFGLGAIGTAAIVAGTAIRSSIASAANFEQQLNTFQAVTKATADDMDQIRASAVALGADISLPAISAGDAADALTELAKAGLSVQDSLAAARGVLQLASAANISAGNAAQIAATQLNAFQLAGSDATRVAELLADASVSAQGEITDFAAAFGQASAVANQVGLSIEDTTGLLTQLGQAGLQGADGGTSLRTALLRLVPTTKEAREFVKALGIEIDESKSIGEQIIPVIEQYRTQLEKLTPVQQQQVLTQIFGQDAIRAASILFTQQEGALKKLTDEFERNNSIQDLSAAKAAGLKGAFGSLQSTFETIGIELGGIVSGPLEEFIRGLNDAATGATEIVKQLSDLIALPEITKNVKIVLNFELPGGGSLGSGIKKGLFFGPSLLGDIGDALADTAATQTVPLPPANAFGGVDFGAGISPGVDESVTAVTKAAAQAASKLDPKLAAALKALEDARKKQVDLAIAVPRGLQQDLVDAQIDDSLQQELGADNAIVAFFKRRLDGLKAGTEKFLVVSGQLAQAQDARDSVLNLINQQREANVAEKERIAKEAERIAKQDEAAQERLRETILNIQEQRLQNKLSVALATPQTDDERRIYNLQIERFKRLRDQAQKIKDASKNGSQEQKDAQLEIEKLNGQIIGTRNLIKNLGKDGASSFSLNDLFKEAVDNFASFGSNIGSRNGVLSAQDARASFSQNIIAQLGQSQLSEAQQQTALLAQIAANTGPAGAGGVAGGQRIDRLGSTPGLPFGAAAKVAALEGYVVP